MPAIRNALVIGGGIGGLTAGVALRQSGIDVDLVETKPNFSVYGVGIIQPNNTLRALDQIGLAARCVELGTPFPGWRIHDAGGNFLMDAPNESHAAPKFPSNNGITRPDLHRILYEAAYAHGVTIHLGTQVHALDDRCDYVRVELTNGLTSDYDLVIGADGLYSETRKRLFGVSVTPQFTGQAVWRHNFARPDHVQWGEIHMGPHSKVGLTPLRSDLMYMFLVTSELGNQRVPEDQLAVLMRQRLEGFGGLISTLRDQITDPTEVVYRPMESLLLPSPWHKGRVIIIGDAAHATTPHLAQGAAMAIEDAVLLGTLLRRDASLEKLLTEFMSRRFNRARFVIESSDRIATWEMEHWSGVSNPDARPGQLLHEASLALLDEY
ncbi:FAD-dependent monooxygenase [Sphingobium phenoxybenzoativorans]|uniref:FAD-dependent monooxygenase n=1 Tax=Sphingobium phenoxybenzoativorans TaxID=1592790 RepID=UPI000871B8D8|nr:FAD-dependent monooxygenase [Sphingobium phenoxybenzoativorans]